MPNEPERILCISSYVKGQHFMRQCAEMGVRPTLLTVEKLHDADWPRDILEDIATMPQDLSIAQILNTVSWMMRGRHFDRVVALDEFDQEAAAAVREHTRIPGMGASTTANFRDKLAMRTSARRAGILMPQFCGIFNYDALRTFMHEVDAPWLLKPRAEASALGIRRIHSPEHLWRTLEELSDEQSRFLLEHFVPGDIYHVDSIVSERKVVFSAVHKYGRPPLQVMHDGGVFTTRTVDRASEDWAELTRINADLAPSLGMVRGVTHAEFIKAHVDGRYYFLEIAARVGGAFISELVETATGVNLWHEWAKLEVMNLRSESYVSPETRAEYAGSVLCLAKTAEPDTSAFTAPEIVLRMKKHHHAGLIVCSPDAARVQQLVEQYGSEFAEHFLARMPAPPRPTA